MSKGLVRGFRHRVLHRWKHKPGFVPWLLSLPPRGLLRLLRILPAPWVLALGDGIGRLAWLSARRRACGRRQIGLALPELPPAERDRLLRRSCGQLGRSAVETLVVAGRFRDRIAEHFDWEDGARELLAAQAGRAPVLVQAHLGGFEAFGAAVAALGLRPGFTMRMPKNVYVARELVASRAGWGIELFPRRGAVRRMLGHLRGGGAVILATDQDAHHAPIFVPWFGRLAATERAAAAIALRTGAPVLACWAIRQPGVLRYRVGARLLREGGARAADDDVAVRELTGDIHAALEPVIRAHPEQYLWVHDRYKTRPPEEA